MKKLAVHWFDKPLTGKFPGNLDDPPDAVRIRGMNFVRTRGAPRHGATHQYREDVTHDSAHMYVTPNGKYVIDHRDRVSPHHSMVGHFARDFVPSIPKLIRERTMSPSHESTKKSAYDFAMEKIAASFAHQAPPPVHEYEQMSPAKWKRAIPDTLASVAGMGIGYGVSRTLMDRLGERYAQEGRKLPGLAKYVPLIGAVGSGAVGYGMSRTRSLLKKRREEAEAAAQAEKEKKSGVEPAPQSRAIPKKKPTDPWNYDPNPAYDL